MVIELKNMWLKLRSIASLLMLFSLSLLIQSCGLFGGGPKDDKGQLIGVQGREGWVMSAPYGMTYVPAGVFHMGQSDEDVPSTMINFNKQVTVSAFFMDEWEISNNRYRQFMESVMSDSLESLGEEFIMQNLYPDTTVWRDDFTHHMFDPMLEYYYQHPAFDDYPVVGVNWEAAKYFSTWRTNYLNDWRSKEGLFAMPRFRLPNEAEWEYAAKGGRDMAPYPWGGPYARTGNGCVLANFKNGRGNYVDDGYAYTAPVDAFLPNDFGLYNMAGNVAEWCEDAYNPAAMPIVWDLNPTYHDEFEPRKIVRGGSWKDVAYYLETGTRTYDYKDSARSYIGFRNAMSFIGGTQR